MTLAGVDRYDPGRVGDVGGRAVVLGGSVAGLCAARVLADGFDEVVVVERDPLPDRPVARDGAPQTSHPHALLTAGQAVLEDLFVGFGEDLIRAGGLVVDTTRNFVEYQRGGFVAPGTERTPTYCATRPLFEHVLRRRLRERDAVRLLSPCRFVGYRTDDAGRAVTGVTVRDGDGPTETLAADLVVDATGRASRTPEWLDDAGYDAPPTDRVEIDLQYSSVRIERPPADRRVVSVPPDPPRTRGAALIPVEDGRWEVILAEMRADGGPTDRAGVVAFAEDLPVDLVGDLLRDRPWVSDDVARYPFPASVRRRYESLDRFPEGLVVTGDAMASFNPVYGQGMSVAALDALVLHHALATGGLDRLGPRFFDRVAPVLDTPWQLAAGADRGFATGDGSASLGTRLFERYFDRLLRRAHEDSAVAAAYQEVVGLERPPTALLRPAVLARVLLPLGGDAERTGPPRTASPASQGPPLADDEGAVERDRPQRPT
ncbi:FAD-dependent oxidoreductase [Halosimplex pelagicum]|uniref:FAD-dependent monooxygenase n=1 Tax=Halosimplex pelagicum TaxID=869886 RepID=A0A7D5P4K9_9EURY|nr:FAD-dependent monooxygenase [Halosimplex pelagicum]QLH80677.1 FAD-dependent monooxygenase [Halosimplex pelagicum]